METKSEEEEEEKKKYFFGRGQTTQRPFVAFEIDSRTTVDEVFERCVNDAKKEQLLC